jgi:hypothetical protein
MYIMHYVYDEKMILGVSLGIPGGILGESWVTGNW